MPELLTHLLAPEQAHRLVITLLHTLWQAALVAVILRWAVLHYLPARSAGARYTASLGALAIVLVAGLATWSILGWETAPPEVPQQAATLPAESAAPPTAEAEPTARPRHETLPANAAASHPAATPTAADRSAPVEPAAYSHFWAKLLAFAWLAGVMLMLLRGLFSLGHVHLRLLRAGQSAPDAVLEAVSRVRHSLGIHRGVRVLVSDRIQMPAVVGVIWPVLLLPVAAVTGLTAEQLRLVIAHELAHVRRHDYLVNLLQLLIEALLFFNPAVWWISRQLRIEREACCDALAAKALSPTAERAPLQRRAMAETLLRFVEHSRQESWAIAATAQHLARSRGGRLLDRTRRLLLPDNPPEIRLPWYSLAGLAVLCVLLLGGLHAATDATVSAIAQALTAKQRVQHLQEAREVLGPAIEDREYTDADNLTVAGRIRTADGEPLPRDVRTSIYSRRHRSSAFHSVAVRDATFEATHISYGHIEVAAWADGYAPSIVGPLTAEPGGRIDDIELVLDRGFTSRVMLVGEDDQPLPGVEIGYTYWRGNRSVKRGTLMTDEQGLAVMENAVNWPCRMNVRMAGYEFEERSIELEPDATHRWRLSPAAPAGGVVIDARTGEPIAGAEIYLVRRYGHANRTTDPRPSHGRRDDPFAVTDDRGRFELTSLHDGSAYTFWIEAEGYGVKMTDDIAAGETDVRLELGGELYVAGTIVDGLDKLHTQGGVRDSPDFGRRYFQWRNPLMLDGTSHSNLFRAFVGVEDGVGHFRLTRLVPGRITLNLPNGNVELDLEDQPIDGLVFDLTDEPATQEYPRRRLVVEFTVPDGDPKPTGTIHVQSYRQGARRLAQTLELTDARAEMDVYVGGTATIQPRDTLGYWFPPESVREVEADEQPLIVEIEPVPAGMIAGRVTDVDGRVPTDTVHVSIVTIEQPEHLGFGSRYSQGASSRPEVDGRFVISPVPLGGTYAIRASRGRGNFVLSDPIELDAAQPVRQVDLRLVEGVDAVLVVRDPDGQPLPRAEVRLQYSADVGGTSYSPNDRTDSQGRLVFQGLNADLPGEFMAHVVSTRDYQPAQATLRLDGQPTVIQLRRGRLLEGQIIDRETGWAIEGVELWAIPRDAPVQMFHPEGTTDSHGTFRFSNLAPGEYMLHMRGVEALDRAASTVVAGQREPARIEVEIQHHWRGRVRVRPPLAMGSR